MSKTVLRVIDSLTGNPLEIKLNADSLAASYVFMLQNRSGTLAMMDDVNGILDAIGAAGGIAQLGSDGKLLASQAPTLSAAASKLNTAREIAMTGDMVWAVTFDGSNNVSATGALSPTGITGGTYRSVTVDEKGRVTGGSNPTTAGGYGITDVYVKSEVDSLLQGLKPKASTRAATSVNITLSGTQTVDGVALAIGDRVLVKNQTTGSQNGIYLVSATAWTRAADADVELELKSAFCFVEEGTDNKDSAWVCTNDFITIGTTTIVFSQFAGSGSYAPISHVGAGGAAHSAATTASAGFMSAADKTKLDGVAANANNYVLPAATATVLGGIKMSLVGTVLTITTA